MLRSNPRMRSLELCFRIGMKWPVNLEHELVIVLHADAGMSRKLPCQGRRIKYVAHLARLEIDATAIEKFVDQIGTVLEYVDQLKGVDTEGVRPTSHAISRTNAFREDEQSGHLDPAAAVLSNAPEKENGSFIVPKVVG